MKHRDKIRLFERALREIQERKPSRGELKDILLRCARELGTKLSWQNEQAEIGQLAGELAVLVAVGRPSQPIAGPVSALVSPRSRIVEPEISRFNFTQFIGANDRAGLDELSRRFRREFTNLRESAIGSIDARFLADLLDRLTADPFKDPLTFVTDPEVGVLDAEQMHALYTRTVGV